MVRHRIRCEEDAPRCCKRRCLQPPAVLRHPHTAVHCHGLIKQDNRTPVVKRGGYCLKNKASPAVAVPAQTSRTGAAANATTTPLSHPQTCCCHRRPPSSRRILLCWDKARSPSSSLHWKPRPVTVHRRSSLHGEAIRFIISHGEGSLHTWSNLGPLRKYSPTGPS